MDVRPQDRDRNEPTEVHLVAALEAVERRVEHDAEQPAEDVRPGVEVRQGEDAAHRDEDHRDDDVARAPDEDPEDERLDCGIGRRGQEDDAGEPPVVMGGGGDEVEEPLPGEPGRAVLEGGEVVRGRDGGVLPDVAAVQDVPADVGVREHHVPARGNHRAGEQEDEEEVGAREGEGATPALGLGVRGDQRSHRMTVSVAENRSRFRRAAGGGDGGGGGGGG